MIISSRKTWQEYSKSHKPSSTYATLSEMREYVNNIQVLKQGVGKDKVYVGARMKKAVQILANAYTRESKVKFFVDGLRPNIRSILLSRSDSQWRKEITISNLILEARDEGVTDRTMTEHIRAVRAVQAGKPQNA